MSRHGRLLSAVAVVVVSVAFAAAGPSGDGPRETSYDDGAGLTLVQGPQISGSGGSAQAPQDADYPMQVRVDGAGTGQAVEIQQWVDGGWREEQRLETDDEGSVTFSAQGRAWYRAVTTVDGEVRAARFSSSLDVPHIWLTEDFDDEAFDFGWMPAEQPSDTATCSRADPASAAVRDGVLALSVRADRSVPCAIPGQVGRTNGHWSVEGTIGPGTVAARVRFPEADAAVGRVWLQPAGATSPWVVDGQHEGVIIAGSVPGDPGRLETGVRWLDPATGERRNQMRAVPEELAAPGDGTFHVFSVEWRPDVVVFRVDGRVVNTVRGASIAFPQTVGLAALSPDGLAFGPTSTTEDLEVDWVRVYAASDVPQVREQ